MLHKTKYLLATTAIMACMIQASPSFSDTVIRETVTDSPSGTRVQKTVTETSSPVTTTQTTVTTVNFTDFDINKDTIMSFNEVAEWLYKFYDTDDNGLIDNNEYERRLPMVVAPIGKDTVVSYDFDGDGITDQTKHTYETFVQETMLSRYDTNKDGLSPHEFTGLDFMAADVSNDKMVDLKEWQGTYIASIDKANKAKANINK